MKRFFISLMLVLTAFVFIDKADATTYKEAMSSSKPMALLVYADWADNVQNLQKVFTEIEQNYGNKYNFVSLNIASEETKDYNKKFFIYPNLPYVFLYRDHGKFSRFLKSDCAASYSCFEEKLKLFAN